MTKRFSFAIAFLAAAAFALSCNGEIPEQAGHDGTGVNAEAVSGEIMTFSCVIADAPDSKVAITGQGKVRWEPGDQILVHGKTTEEGKSATVTLTSSDISADGRTATISFSGVTPYDRTDKGYSSSLFAGYPASAVPMDETCYYYTNFRSTTVPLMAAYNEGDTFVFYNLCGVLSFTVSGNFDSYEFSGNAEETVGYSYLRTYLVQQTTGTPRLDFTYSNSTDGGTNGPLTSVTGKVKADGTTVNYLGIPLGADFSSGFTFKFYKNDELVKVATTEKPVKVDRSHLLILGDITSHLADPSPDEEHISSIALGSATDLSSSESANCYIVTAPGNYKFKAVQGNGSTSVGKVGGVQLVWETCGTAEAPEKNSIISAVDFQDKWICFSTPSSLKPGNALIAAKNSSGQILWSWHIWIPQTTIGSDTHKMSTHRIMDRNLGALVATQSSGTAAPESFGLLYQWGRKDPFIGGSAIGSSATAGFTGTGMSTSGGAISLAESIAGPTVFATPPSETDWCTASNGDYWGDTSGSKSVYDPCPEGYKVPRREDIAGLFRSDLNGATNFNYSSSLGRYTVGNPVMVVPLCGYRETSGGLSHCSDRSILWNAHHDSSSPYAGYSQYMYYSDNAVQSKTWSQSKARAGSLRCISEEEVPFENAPGMPVQGGYTRTVFDSTIQELSGICFSKDKDFIWGVGDEGDIFKITLDFQISIYKSTGSDLEDVTLDPNTGDLYFAKEADRVDKMAAPSYSSKAVAFYVEEAANFGNSGLEGIAYYKDDILYVGAQTGATLWAYKKDGTKIWKKQLGTIAPQIQEVGGLCYDAEKDWLWVSDSEACKLFVFDGEVTELLAIYDVSFIGNAESVMVDRAKGMVYVGDDGSTSKIYKISFSNL
jgi:hypothetical protein